jgi:hypothetical protein
MTEGIFDRLLDDWHDATSRLSRHHDQPGVTMTAAAPAVTTETQMSLITEVKTELKDLALKAEGIDEAAAEKIAALEGNPVVDALLAAAHVPDTALAMAVDLLNGLAGIYPMPEDAQAAAAPAEAAPVAA